MMLIVGSGVAGLSCALAAAEAGAPVTLVTPGQLATHDARAGGNTAMAQGGIAAAMGADDAPALHAADTVAAGVGIVDRQAATVLTADGAAAVTRLLAAGFAADRTPDGALVLGLEAAHGRARIVHAGEDRTGAALHAFLTAQVLDLVRAGRVELVEGAAAVSLLSDTGAVAGAVLADAAGRLSAVRADAVVLATGGYSGLYSRTSGSPAARGEGIVLAARAGALVADLEFVQFHPTALTGSGFLVSEAVRGAGAVLRDGSGERFMPGVHPDAELAPRDVVARALHRLMRDRAEECVWLDATGIEREGGPGTLARRFPSITAAALAQGFDWAQQPIPVAPAAHYAMGGIVTDLDGRSSVPGLFAAGEVATTGVHGANRLASNSLLEGLVFGRRAGRAAAEHAGATAAGRANWAMNGQGAAELVAEAEELPVSQPSGAQVQDRGATRTSDHVGPGSGAGRTARDAEVRAAADAGLGIERDAEGLRAVAAVCAGAPGALSALAAMVAASAGARTESRGAHQRADYPQTDSSQARRLAWALPRAARLHATSDLTAHTPQESLAAC